MSSVWLFTEFTPECEGLDGCILMPTLGARLNDTNPALELCYYILAELVWHMGRNGTEQARLSILFGAVVTNELFQSVITKGRRQ